MMVSLFVMLVFIFMIIVQMDIELNPFDRRFPGSFGVEMISRKPQF